MTKRNVCVGALVLAAAVNGWAQPNMIVILADDFGVGSVNAYGAPHELVRTPHLDQLAQQGMRFTNASTPSSICSPTRYALLTGRYAWRGPLPFGVVNVYDPMVVETGRPTVASLLKTQGYRTAQVGKWHLGYGSRSPTDYTQPLVPGPNDVGFDYHFGLPQNLDDLLRVWIENDGVYGLRSERLSPYAKSFYGRPYAGLDAPQRRREEANAFLTERAADWIRSTHRTHPDDPFFLYFAPPAVHHPIVPSEAMRGASGCGAYGDFIQDLDLSVGRIIETLEYEGLAANTLILFTADNGGDIPANDPTRPEVQARTAGLLANGAQRGDKHTIYEGGLRVPLIVRWDGRVAPGSVNDDMVNIVDLCATLVEAATGEPPPREDAPDSVSFLASLLGRPAAEREPMVVSNVAGVLAVRSGKWKWIEGRFPEGVPPGMRNRTSQEAAPALYDLEADPVEAHNLIAEYPEVARDLRKTLEGIRMRSFSRQPEPEPLSTDAGATAPVPRPQGST